MQGLLSGSAGPHAEGIAVLLESTLNRGWTDQFEIEMLTVMVFSTVRHAWPHGISPVADHIF